ncbi:MAG: DUF4142 domain-containing protein [Terriglobales bacterium]
MCSSRQRLTTLLGLSAIAVWAAVGGLAHPLSPDRAAISAWATFAQGQCQTARLMRKKATLPRTRRFARATERLFGEALRQLRTAARAADEPVQINPTGLQRWQILRSRLRNLDGATSDRDYLRAVAQADVRIRGHIARVQGHLGEPDVRAYTRRWLLLTGRHLQAAWGMRPQLAGGLSFGLPSRGYLPPNYNAPRGNLETP